MDKDVLKKLEEIGASLTKAASVLENSSKVKEASNGELDSSILSEAYVQCRLSGYLKCLEG